MVWIVEKKVFYHSLDLGFGRVKIPIRAKFEFEVRDGALVPDSLSKTILYNKQVLEKRYPSLDLTRLQRSIDDTVNHEIDNYFRACGYFGTESQ